MNDVMISRIDKTGGRDLEAFLQFPMELYSDRRMTRYNILKTRKMVAGPGDFDLYLARNGADRVVGRMVLGSNPLLLDEKGVPYGCAGLFDVVEDYEVFRRMLDYARNYFRDRNHLLFPFFKATWYPYRFAVRGREKLDYFMEYPDREYYGDFTRRYGVEESYLYRSRLNYDMDGNIEKNRSAYEKALAGGITFRSLDKTRPREEMRIIYDLTVENFQESLFYTDISFEEFYSLYEGILSLLDARFMTFAFDDRGEPVGYGFTTPDFTPLLRRYDTTRLWGKLLFYLNRHRFDGIIPKTAAVRTSYRQMGIFGAIYYLHNVLARELGCRYILGGYVYIGNVTYKVMTGETQDKEYELYKIRV